LPKLSNLEAVAEKTDEDFLFPIKANQEMTHRREDASIFKAFYQVLEPTISAGKLDCILAKFPYSFRPSRSIWDYLKLFRERMGELPVVIEFRNTQWLRSEMFDWLRRLDLGFCCVNELQLPHFLPSVAEATNSISYIRLHGRNSAKWWQYEYAYERYDHSYAPQELSDWLPKIRKLGSMTEKTFIFANNHWWVQAVNTIRQLRVMLD